MANTPAVVNSFAHKANIHAEAFTIDQTTKTVVIDLHHYVNNKAIQVSAVTGTLTMTLSLDGITYSNSTTPTTGITAITTPCRYIKLTIATAGGNSATGLIFGSLY